VERAKWNHMDVVVRFCTEKGTTEEFRAAVRELIELPPHPNVVQVYGFSFDEQQTALVLEYCSGGSSLLSLDGDTRQKSLLVWNKMNYKVNENYVICVGTLQENLNNVKLFEVVKGIVDGMIHLHKHNIVHGNLTAKNILLTKQRTPKISVLYHIHYLKVNLLFILIVVFIAPIGLRDDEIGVAHGDRTSSLDGTGVAEKWRIHSQIRCVDVWCRRYDETEAKLNWFPSLSADLQYLGFAVWEIVTQQEPQQDIDDIRVNARIQCVLRFLLIALIKKSNLTTCDTNLSDSSTFKFTESPSRCWWKFLTTVQNSSKI
jgi:hypothetical protein